LGALVLRRQIGGHDRGYAEESGVREGGQDARGHQREIGWGERAENIANRKQRH
jgi:hypothetical protein